MDTTNKRNIVLELQKFSLPKKNVRNKVNMENSESLSEKSWKIQNRVAAEAKTLL